MAAPAKVPLPKPRPAIHIARPAPAPLARNVPFPAKRVAPAVPSAFAQASVGLHGGFLESRNLYKPLTRPVSGPFSMAPTAATSADDIAAVKRVIEATNKGKQAEAEAAENSIKDPVARKLAEWVFLRSDNTNPSFERYAAFATANPGWPHAPLFRRRAENALWNDHLDDKTVQAFFAQRRPSTAKGHYVLARALLAKGDREAAAALVRQAWRYEDCSGDTETKVLEMFGGLLTRAALLCRRRRGWHARRQPARRRRTGDRPRPRGGDQAAEQCQGAARRGAGRCAPRSRLHFRARAMAAQRK
jgi:soluble lytic murein transglycosylase